jgi:Tfp pilus assembly protein PilP
MCDCGCRNGKLCDLHQFIWETRMKAQRVLDEMPEPTRWERFKLWWTTGGSEFRLDDVRARPNRAENSLRLDSFVV